MTTKTVSTRETTRFPKVSLVEPTSSGYLHLAAEIDGRLPFLPNSPKKQKLIAASKRWCRQLEAEPNVVSAVVFDAFLIPQGRGEFIKERPDQVHIARFDLSVLIETTTPEAAEALRVSSIYTDMERAIRKTASFTHSITATNVRRMGAVDHGKQGVFLFNYFFADDTAQNIAVWEETAGWWEQETGLDNSAVLLPHDGESNYNVINHCRWDHLRDVLPALLFKRTFRSFVLANFRANRVAAMPILYRLA